jgi:RHS repeat-associated protein
VGHKGAIDRLHEQWSYGYDAAGNLIRRGNHQLAETFSVANARNELSSVSASGTLTVAGAASTNATNVKVNGQDAVLYDDQTFAFPGVALTNTTLTALVSDAQGHTNRHTIRLNAAGTASFQYDGNGNLIFDGRRTFSYDTENQLVSVVVTNHGQGTASQTLFQYDGRLRRRVRTEQAWQAGAWVTSQVVRYLYDGNQVIQERDGNNTVLVTYTRGLDLSGSLEGAGGIGGLLARTHPGSHHFYYHADANGNITAIVGATQGLVAQYRYDPFGNIVSQRGPMAEYNRYRFSSKEFHAGSGLYYYGYRYYEPNLQRFLNRDPIHEWGGIDLFGFAGNNPIGQIDPFGLDFKMEQGCGLLTQGPFGYLKGDSGIENAAAGVYNTLPLIGNVVSRTADSMLAGFDAFFNRIPRAGGQAVQRVTGNVSDGVLAENALKAAMWFMPVGKGCQCADAATMGENLVYRSINTAGDVNYVGITGNLERRAAEHLTQKSITIQPIPGLQNLSCADARAVEQVLIETHGLGANGGTLFNKINSISPNNPIYQVSIQRGTELLHQAGYPGF